MKYGQHLKENFAPEYGSEPYLEYDKLDDIIRELSDIAPVKYVDDCAVCVLSFEYPLLTPASETPMLYEVPT